MLATPRLPWGSSNTNPLDPCPGAACLNLAGEFRGGAGSFKPLGRMRSFQAESGGGLKGVNTLKLWGKRVGSPSGSFGS